MTIDVEAYLRSKNLNVKRATATEVHLPCLWCDEAQGARGRLYVNCNPDQEPPGLFTCFLCGKRGALRTFLKFFGDPIPKDEDDRSYLLNDMLNQAAAYYHDALVDNEEAYRYLRYERGLDVETIIKNQLGWANGGLKKHLQEQRFTVADMQKTGLVDHLNNDFFRDEITIPYHVTGSVVMIRGKQIGGKYRTPSGQKGRLFGTDNTWGAETILIAEGEMDQMVLGQLGFSAVGVPGAASWQPSWNGYFDEAKKVYVCLDPDAAGILGADKICRALGPKAKTVTLPVEGEENAKDIDPSYLVVKRGWDRAAFDLLLVKSKGGLLLSVHDAFAEWDSMQGIAGLELGIPGIDHKIAPGLLPAQLLVLLAATNVGKTVWLLNVFHHVIMTKPGARILFVSLEQTRSEWYERARRIYQFHNINADAKDCLAFYQDHLTIVDKNRLTEETLIECLVQHEYEFGKKPDLVAVDYLGYWARAFKGEPYERTSAAVMALKAIAKDQGIAIISPHQLNRSVHNGEEMEGSAARDSGVVPETADFLLGMWQPDNRKGTQIDERKNQIHMKILKSRHGGTGAQVVLQFAPLSLAMVPLSSESMELFQRAQQDAEYAMKGDNFETAIYRHRTGDRNFSYRIGGAPPSSLVRPENRGLTLVKGEK